MAIIGVDVFKLYKELQANIRELMKADRLKAGSDGVGATDL